MEIKRVTQYQPDAVSPVWDTVIDLLKQRHLSIAHLERAMGCPKGYINEVAQGAIAMSFDTACQLELMFAVSAEFWLERDAQYRASLANTLHLQVSI